MALYKTGCLIEWDFNKSDSSNVSNGMGGTDYLLTNHGADSVLYPSGAYGYNFNPNNADYGQCTRLAAVDDNTTFTIEWAAFSGNAPPYMFFTKGAWSALHYWAVYYDTNGRIVLWRATGTSGSNYVYFVSDTGTYTNFGYHHYVITADGANPTTATAHLYVDGVEKTFTRNAVGTDTTWSTNAAADIYVGQTADNKYNAYVRVMYIRYWNAALPSGDVAAMAAANYDYEKWRWQSWLITTVPTCLTATGAAATEISCTPPVPACLTATGTVSVEIVKEIYEMPTPDTSTAASTVGVETMSGLLELSMSSPDSTTATETVGVTASSPIYKTGCYLEWDFNQAGSGNVSNTITPETNDLTNSGASSALMPSGAYEYYFIGYESDYGTSAAGANVDDKNTFTIEWAGSVNNAGVVQMAFTKGTATTGHWWAVYYETTGRVGLYRSTAAGTVSFVSDNNINANYSWHHYVITAAGDNPTTCTAALYVDGVSKTFTKAQTGTDTTWPTNAAYAIYVGQTSDGGYHLTGPIAFIRYWNAALPSNDPAALATANYDYEKWRWSDVNKSITTVPTSLVGAAALPPSIDYSMSVPACQTATGAVGPAISHAMPVPASCTTGAVAPTVSGSAVNVTVTITTVPDTLTATGAVETEIAAFYVQDIPVVGSSPTYTQVTASNDSVYITASTILHFINDGSDNDVITFVANHPDSKGRYHCFCSTLPALGDRIFGSFDLATFGTTAMAIHHTQPANVVMVDLSFFTVPVPSTEPATLIATEVPLLPNSGVLSSESITLTPLEPITSVPAVVSQEIRTLTPLEQSGVYTSQSKLDNFEVVSLAILETVSLGTGGNTEVASDELISLVETEFSEVSYVLAIINETITVVLDEASLWDAQVGWDTKVGTCEGEVVWPVPAIEVVTLDPDEEGDTV